MVAIFVDTHQRCKNKVGKQPGPGENTPFWDVFIEDSWGRLGDSEVARSLLGFLKFLDVPCLPDGSDFLCWFKVLRELNFFFGRSLNSDNLSIFIIRQ